jgi:hypothetical protein
VKVITILYNIVFGILSSLGLPIAVTNLLALLSLLAIAFGIIIISPQVALVIALILLISFLFHS